MTKSGFGSIKPEPAGPPLALARGPRPWRSFLVCLLVVGVIVAFGRDLLASVPGGPEAPGIAGRIASDPFRLALVSATIAALLYAGLQLLGLRVDVRAISEDEEAARPRPVLRRLLGRPAADGVEAWEISEAQVVADWGGDAIVGPLRMGITAFPMVGFIGTVVGLSGAIEALPRAMSDEGALGEVLGSLHVAFDTTLLGLVGALGCLAGARAIDEAVDALARRLDGAS